MADVSFNVGGGGQPPAPGGLSFMPTGFDSAGAGGAYGGGGTGGAYGGGGGGFGGGGFGAANAYAGPASFEDEPPLLEELGIDLPHIYKKTLSVLNPLKVDERLMDDGDLTGPLLFCLALATCHLLTGKLHYGYILGWTLVFMLGLYWLLNLLAGANSAGGGIELYRCASLYGYCMLPLVLFAALGVLLPHRLWLMLPLAIVAVAWCTRTCAALLLRIMPGLEDQRALVGYAVGLSYSLFALLTVY